MKIQNINVNKIIESCGSPLYIYDADILEQNYRNFIDAFQMENMQLFFACKALGNQEILKTFLKLGSGVDVVSVNEIEMAFQAGFTADKILFTPNMISEEELEYAIAKKVKINIGSINLLEYMGENHPTYPVGIRINPHIMAGGHKKISTGHIDSKFGISIHQLPLVLRLVESWKMKIIGVHMHNGSDIFDAQVFINGAEVLFEVARNFTKNLEYIDFGSGFKVPYHELDAETDMSELGPAVKERFIAFEKEIGRPLTMFFEPGKFLVSKAGYFYSKINQIKQTTSTVFIGLNTGFNHFPRPMFYDAYHTVENITSTSTKKKVYTIVGHICETDTFGINRVLPASQEGDILCIHNAGAYCYEMSSNYNAHGRPAEVLVKKGKAILIRRRETLDDLLQTQCTKLIF